MAEVSLSLLAIGSLLLYRLDSLVPNFSASEIVTRISSSSLHAILHDPLFAPYKLLQYCLIRTGYLNVFAMRLVSVLFGAIAIYVMYYVLKKWHSHRVALMGTVLFATSSWFLHYARLATPSITYTLLLAALAYGTWIRHTRKPGIAVLIGTGLILSFIYIPGLIWFAVIGVIWQKQSVVRMCSKAPKITVIAALSLLVLLVPLGYAVYQNTLLLRSLAGLPQNTWPTLALVKNNAVTLADLLFFRGNKDAMVGLVGLAVFDVFALAMLVLGIYDYILMRKLDRIKMLGGTLLLGTILICLGGPVNSILLTPFMYVVIAAGVGWLLEQWFTVFPRNPLVRTIGLSLLLVAVGLSCWYQLNRYFVAWPHTKATKQVFTIKS
ncbi:MAG TPA: glycosyltransferase family 39 protein [Candidatus Saccharimonadales bacterium]|nr:glycosyltransferase family 39 protein [Candidatus Saccharimonadales bacterium]